ncbi:5-oxoprolinase subunit C family protein [Robiginitomaculum antarcticum]|uniref:5-oxoprolinase subunit C family protein n=1 Tax=Robiginitomaculum antarcticum TaxID=437507 RepID=UPI00037B63DC|nr:biotin-dependent carboxyltransferase family protein [Robiginitomaculum antarcticum]
MSAALKIISGGVQTTVQDPGRAGLRHMGVPAGGAADPRALMRANDCMGNQAGAAALEFTLTGPHIRFSGDTAFAVTGAVCDIMLDGRRVAPYQGHVAKAGSVLEVGAVMHGARGYISFDREIMCRAFGGSKSTHIYSALGGHEGRALIKGDGIALGPRSGAAISSAEPLRITTPHVLRILPGPEYDRLTDKAKTLLTMARFSASPQTDRMGARLIGPKLGLRLRQHMISSALLPGTLQLPAGGQIVLSLVDSHCTGGYVRAARVITRDLPLTGQIRPGAPIWFRWATEADL